MKAHASMHTPLECHSKKWKKGRCGVVQLQGFSAASVSCSGKQEEGLQRQLYIPGLQWGKKERQEKTLWQHTSW
jgi:hypothetical protein